MWGWFHKLSSPRYWYQFSRGLVPISAVLTICLLGYGFVDGLYFAPADYQQGDAYRIIYIHVPSAILSLTLYSAMAVAALVGFVWNLKLSDLFIRSCARLGFWFTTAALITGAIWGKPMWGAWWVWDARLTSELILLFLYLGVIALANSIPDEQLGNRAVRILVLVGSVNIPIIHYSVYWWNTLHQGDTLNLFGKSLISPSMLHPLLAMILGFISYAILVVTLHLRNEILLRERKTTWAQKVLAS